MDVQKIDYDKWLSMTIDSFHRALDKYSIGEPDGRLWKSIMGQVIHSGQDVEQIIIKFMQYGRFVDRGSGRNSKKTGAHYGRITKPWFSKVKTHEVNRLRELIISKLNNQVIHETETGLKGEFTLKLSSNGQ